MENIVRKIRGRSIEWMTIIKRDLTHAPKLANSKRLLCYAGWVGYGNLGDELLFEAHKKLFPNHELIPYHPKSLSAIVTKLNKKKFDACILGGGTLINLPGAWLHSTQSMLKLGLPMISIGTGVNFELQDGNPILSLNDTTKDWATALNQFQYLGVRGSYSAHVLTSLLAKPPEIIGDTALAMTPEACPPYADNKVVGICVGHSKEIPVPVDDDAYRTTIVTFIQNIIDKGFRVNLLPVYSKDRSFNESIIRNVNDRRCSLIMVHEDSKKYFGEAVKCALFIGQKLHGTVIGTMLRVPSLMIAYHPKCVEYMASIDMLGQTIPIESLETSMLGKRFFELYEKRHAIREILDRNIRYYRAAQYEKAKQLERSFNDSRYNKNLT